MSERPWMPLDVGDYLKDTRHLTTLEHGAYLLLIMRYWEDGFLPDNEALIARYAGLTPEQWAESRAVFAALFDEGWKHKRIDAELARAAEVMEKRRASGKQGGAKRQANARQVLEQTPSKTQHTYTDTNSSSLRSELPEPIGSSGEPPKTIPIDARDALFGDGLSMLAKITGRPAAKCRPLLGKWLKSAGDDALKVRQVIEQAATDRIADPIPWIERSLGPPVQDWRKSEAWAGVDI